MNLKRIAFLILALVALGVGYPSPAADASFSQTRIGAISTFSPDCIGPSSPLVADPHRASLSPSLNLASDFSVAARGIRNSVPANFEFARILKPSQIADIQAGRNPLLSTFPNATDAFITSSQSLPSGLSRSALADLARIPEANVGGIIRFRVPGGQGLASPINRNIPGFVGRGRTGAGLPEFVIPNEPVGSFDFILESLR